MPLDTNDQRPGGSHGRRNHGQESGVRLNATGGQATRRLQADVSPGTHMTGGVRHPVTTPLEDHLSKRITCCWVG